MGKLNLRTALKAKNAQGLVKSLKGPGFSWVAPKIADFYGVGEGRIALHLRTENAVLDGTGKVIGITNAGGAGALFNATVNGTSLPMADNLLQINGTASGIPTLNNPADLMNVRFFWVMPTDNLIHNTRYFGFNAGTYGNELVYLYAAQGSMIRPYTNKPGHTTTVNLSRSQYPTSGLHIFEYELTATSAVLYIDGVISSQATHTLGWTDFYIDRIGQGITQSAPYVGGMGDIIGVTLGTGSARAIKIARLHLSKKYGIPVSL